MVSARCVALAAFSVLVSAAPSGVPVLVDPASLARDDACLAEDASCSLNALQLARRAAGHSRAVREGPASALKEKTVTPEQWPSWNDFAGAVRGAMDAVTEVLENSTDDLTGTFDQLRHEAEKALGNVTENLQEVANSGLLDGFVKEALGNVTGQQGDLSTLLDTLQHQAEEAFSSANWDLSKIMAAGNATMPDFSDILARLQEATEASMHHEALLAVQRRAGRAAASQPVSPEDLAKAIRAAVVAAREVLNKTVADLQRNDAARQDILSDLADSFKGVQSKAQEVVQNASSRTLDARLNTQSEVFGIVGDFLDAAREAYKNATSNGTVPDGKSLLKQFQEVAQEALQSAGGLKQDAATAQVHVVSEAVTELNETQREVKQVLKDFTDRLQQTAEADKETLSSSAGALNDIQTEVKQVLLNATTGLRQSIAAGNATLASVAQLLKALRSSFQPEAGEGASSLVEVQSHVDPANSSSKADFAARAKEVAAAAAAAAATAKEALRSLTTNLKRGQKEARSELADALKDFQQVAKEAFANSTQQSVPPNVSELIEHLRKVAQEASENATGRVQRALSDVTDALGSAADAFKQLQPAPASPSSLLAVSAEQWPFLPDSLKAVVAAAKQAVNKSANNLQQTIAEQKGVLSVITDTLKDVQNQTKQAFSGASSRLQEGQQVARAGVANLVDSFRSEAKQAVEQGAPPNVTDFIAHLQQAAKEALEDAASRRQEAAAAAMEAVTSAASALKSLQSEALSNATANIQKSAASDKEALSAVAEALKNLREEVLTNASDALQRTMEAGNITLPGLENILKSVKAAVTEGIPEAPAAPNSLLAVAAEQWPAWAGLTNKLKGAVQAAASQNVTIFNIGNALKDLRSNTQQALANATDSLEQQRQRAKSEIGAVLNNFRQQAQQVMQSVNISALNVTAIREQLEEVAQQALSNATELSKRALQAEAATFSDVADTLKGIQQQAQALLNTTASEAAP